MNEDLLDNLIHKEPDEMVFTFNQHDKKLKNDFVLSEESENFSERSGVNKVLENRYEKRKSMM